MPSIVEGAILYQAFLLTGDTGPVNEHAGSPRAALHQFNFIRRVANASNSPSARIGGSPFYEGCHWLPDQCASILVASRMQKACGWPYVERKLASRDVGRKARGDDAHDNGAEGKDGPTHWGS